MTTDEIVARLEEAGMTLFCLPPARLSCRLGYVVSCHLDAIVPVAREAWGPIRMTPEPAAIDRMDEAMSWLSLISQDRYVLRRIVAARMMVNPLTGAHLYPWRRIATAMGADHKAVQRWHRQGIALIRNSLPDTERRAA